MTIGLLFDVGAMSAATYALTTISPNAQLLMTGVHAALNAASEKSEMYSKQLKIADLVYVPVAARFFGASMQQAVILGALHLGVHLIEEGPLESKCDCKA